MPNSPVGPSCPWACGARPWQGRLAIYQCKPANHPVTPVPGRFDEVLIRHQVKYLGLMENLRVRRAGFAYRRKYEAFLQRWGRSLALWLRKRAGGWEPPRSWKGGQRFSAPFQRHEAEALSFCETHTGAPPCCRPNVKLGKENPSPQSPCPHGVPGQGSIRQAYTCLSPGEMIKAYEDRGFNEV